MVLAGGRGLRAGLIGGLIGFWRAKSFVRVTLTLQDLSARFVVNQTEGDSYKPPQLSPQTLVNFLTSAELLSYVSSNAVPPISERKLLSSLSITQEKNSENIAVVLVGKIRRRWLRWPNLYASAAVKKAGRPRWRTRGWSIKTFRRNWRRLRIDKPI